MTLITCSHSTIIHRAALESQKRSLQTRLKQQTEHAYKLQRLALLIQNQSREAWSKASETKAQIDKLESELLALMLQDPVLQEQEIRFAQREYDL